MLDLQLDGKVALVTAASKGLGKAAAWELARQGARVALCARGEETLLAAQEIQDDTSSPVLGVRADLTVAADIRKFVTKAVQEFGRVDVLVINAGGAKSGQFLALNENDWLEAVQLTLMSAVRLCYEVVPIMLSQRGGSIIASQSVSVKQPVDNLILSNSVRLSVIGLMKSLANELGPKGIRVNSINPGNIFTDRTVYLLEDRARVNDTSYEQELEKENAGIPLKRMGTLEEYGQAIAWLASPAAGYLHGQALVYDGGLAQFPL
jgi:3-oxoacyl-[acyl-carrier protein] reductase